MNYAPESFVRDIEAVQSISEVPRLLDACRLVSGMPSAAISRVVGAHWLICAVHDDEESGIQVGDKIPFARDTSEEFRRRHSPLIMRDMHSDPAFRHHPTHSLRSLGSCIAVPILRKNGTFFGMLATFQKAPLECDPNKVIAIFQLFSEIISAQLDEEDQIQRERDNLAGEREHAKRREEFIGVVAHDLRNPLAALSAGLRILGRNDQSDEAQSLIGEMELSVQRMSSIICNLLDFARGRLGAGMATISDHVDLRQIIETVVREVEAISTLPVECNISVPDRVACDGQRIGQLLSNLLNNAQVHGAKDQPIRLTAHSSDGMLEISIANRGTLIEATTLSLLFEPFYRHADAPRETGVGLGLYIASEIAKSHHGTLSARSNEAETVFTFRMPLD